MPVRCSEAHWGGSRPGGSGARVERQGAGNADSPPVHRSCTPAWQPMRRRGPGLRSRAARRHCFRGDAERVLFLPSSFLGFPPFLSSPPSPSSPALAIAMTWTTAGDRAGPALGRFPPRRHRRGTLARTNLLPIPAYGPTPLQRPPTIPPTNLSRRGERTAGPTTRRTPMRRRRPWK